MAGTEQTRIEILLDGRQASDQLKDLSKNAATLRIELAKAYQANDAGKVAETEWELNKLNTRMKQLRKETVDVQAVLNNLSGATMSDLRQSIASVDTRLNSKNIKRNSEEWNKLTEVKRTLIAEQKKLRQEMGATDGAIRKQRLSVADWIVSLGIVQRAFNGVKNFLRESLYSFNAFEKSVKGLSSLTGLTGSELDYLSDHAKKLSTSTLEGGIIIRQSATEIADAYKMIGSQRPELLRNKEALNQVTQEAIILSEAAEMELQPASKALTNSLNQFNASADQSRRFINVLAAGSQAGAGDINYLSQAIEKSGTTANLMGLEFEQLVALIETAAPKFSEAAVAGNSIDKVLMEMKAKQIGYRDGVFDVNAALDELAGRFAKGELAADIFGKEHAKMVEVLVDGREELKRYQEAVTGTNKAIEQAATNTDTNDARLKQQQNRLEQLRIELGEKLTPLVGAFTSGTASLIQVLIPMVEIIGKYKTTVGLLTIALAGVAMKEKILHGIELLRNVVGKESVLVGRARILSMNSHIAALKLQTLVTGSATMAEKRHIVAIRQKITAMKTANAALAKTPWGLLATGASMAIGLIIDLIKNTNKLSESQKRLNEIDQQYTGNLREQTGQMEMLMVQIRKTNPGTEERIKLVDRLNELIPNVVDKQTLYGASLQDLKKYEAEYRTELEKRIRMQANEAKYTELVQQQMEAEEELLKAHQALARSESELNKANTIGSGEYFITATRTVEKARERVEELERELQNIQALKDKIDFTSAGSDDNHSASDSGSVIKPGSDIRKNETGKALENQQKYREEILFQAKSALEQEDQLYEERLKKAGLFGKKQIALNSEDAGILQALEKEHQAKILQITLNAEKQKQQQLSQAVKKELDTKKADYERELTELRIRHNEALADETLTAGERKDLQEKHRQEERELTIRHTRDLIAVIQQILNSTEIDGIDLAGNIFTPEEKEKLEAEVLKAREMLSGLYAEASEKKEGGETDAKQPAGLPKADVDILGMTPEMWETFFTNLEQGKYGIEEMQAAANALMSVWGTVNDFMAAKEKKQLQQYEKNTKAKKAALDKQLDAGKISQEQYNARVSQLDAELNAKKAEIENKQAKRQKTMAIADVIKNTALAIMSIWAQVPKFDFGATAGILTAMVSALGAAQLAIIAAQPLPGAESGGFIDVVRSQDGRHFKAKDDPDRRGYIDRPTVITGESGREFVVNDEAVSNPTVKSVLDVIDAAQQNGTVGRLDLTRYIPQYSVKARGGSLSENTGAETTGILREIYDPEFKRLLQANLEMMKALKEKKIEIPWYGKGGIDEKMKKATKYERQISTRS